MHNQLLIIASFYLILTSVFNTGCAHSDSHEYLSTTSQPPQVSAQQQLAEFDQVLNKNPEQVWSSTLSQKLKLAIHSVRFYSLKEKCWSADAHVRLGTCSN